MTDSICDGFSEGTDIEKYCPNCKKETSFRLTAYYDMGKCYECGTVYEMVIE